MLGQDVLGQRFRSIDRWYYWCQAHLHRRYNRTKRSTLWWWCLLLHFFLHAWKTFRRGHRISHSIKFRCHCAGGSEQSENKTLLLRTKVDRLQASFQKLDRSSRAVWCSTCGSWTLTKAIMTNWGMTNWGMTLLLMLPLLIRVLFIQIWMWRRI